jgi:hypothetical protein
MNETRALARFVAQTRFDDLPRGPWGMSGPFSP